MKNVNIVILALLLLAVSCSKDEPRECTVPDLIQNENGIEAVTCTVNGKFWKAYAPLNFSGPASKGAKYSKNENKFSLGANLKIYGNDYGHPCFERADTIDQSIGIACILNNTNRCEILSHEYNFRDVQGYCLKNNLSWHYQIDTTQPHYIDFVRFDTTTRGWAIGTFQFDAINEICKDTVRVRDGRFELLF